MKKLIVKGLMHLTVTVRTKQIYLLFLEEDGQKKLTPLKQFAVNKEYCFMLRNSGKKCDVVLWFDTVY